MPVPDNLPLQLTSFIGREREMARVRALLTSSRLVTLTGPGGVGKTRLALELATGLAGEYTDGAWLVELTSLVDASLVPHSVATALGVREEGDCPITDTLTGYLGARQALLVLDNCEHLLAASAALAEHLLQRCPELRLLATSREALNVPGEIAWLVPSLSVRDEAVRLFIERASAALPNTDLARWDQATVEDICQRLDGIPLAIELAATRVKALSVEQIAARLDDRFRLLAGGARTAVARHQTLRALVDWSYELLSDEERCLLRRLSVFAGGWTLRAAEAVCAGDGIEPDAVLRLLTQLVEKSLVVAERRGSEYRYRLLETLRQYAAEKLASAGESEVLRTRHLDYLVSLAEPGYGDTPRAQLLRLLDPDLDNTRAALSWSMDGGDALMGLRLAAALGTHWNVGGHPTEGRSWLTALLARTPDKSDEVSKAARARALAASGYLATILGDLDAAAEPIHEGLRLWQELGNGRQASFCVRWLGRLAILQHQPEVARMYLEEALSIARNIGHEAAVYEALHALGVVIHELGECDHAAALLEEALALAKEHHDPVWTHLCTLNLGAIALERGDFAAARQWLLQSLSAAPKNEGWVARTLEVFAALAAARGHPARALRLAGAVAALERHAGATVPPRFQAAMGQRMELIRQTADQKHAASAWAEGRAMDMHAAIAYALEDDISAPKAPRLAAELTAREREVAALLAGGLTNPQIAERLVVSRGTVKRHIENMLTKLDLASRSQIATWAAQHGLLDEAPVG